MGSGNATRAAVAFSRRARLPRRGGPAGAGSAGRAGQGAATMAQGRRREVPGQGRRALVPRRDRGRRPCRYTRSCSGHVCVIIAASRSRERRFEALEERRSTGVRQIAARGRRRVALRRGRRAEPKITICNTMQKSTFVAAESRRVLPKCKNSSVYMRQLTEINEGAHSYVNSRFRNGESRRLSSERNLKARETENGQGHYLFHEHGRSLG